jgi:hypothetical protein
VVGRQLHSRRPLHAGRSWDWPAWPSDRSQRNGSPVEHQAHPETGAPITGEEIPGWQHFMARVLELCEALHFLDYIGWDIAITEDGFQIIEGNSPRTCGCLQIQGPLLANPHVWRFYEAHGVVRAPRACVDALAGARCS